jgi:hypothetical protein
MKTYCIAFFGRLRGAIGVSCAFTKTIQATNEEAAILKMYDEYDHIQQPSITEVPVYYECEICGHFHSVNWWGDCREDNARFTDEELDEKHGRNGWEIKDLEDTKESK